MADQPGHIPNGGAWAAILAAGVGCASIGLLIDLVEASKSFSAALTLSKAVGDLSGKTADWNRLLAGRLGGASSALEAARICRSWQDCRSHACPPGDRDDSRVSAFFWPVLRRLTGRERRAGPLRAQASAQAAIAAA